MINRLIVVIAGCTASGKSNIALKVAKQVKGVIINADSRQIYKEISIGTAKPTPDRIVNDIFVVENIKHYLYSSVSVKEEYNLYRYQKDVFSLLEKFPKEQIPILVGGTGLYIDSVVYNYKLKKNLEKERTMQFESMDVKELQKLVGEEKLAELNESDKQNPRRLIHILKHGLPSMEKGDSLNHLYFFLDIKAEILKRNIRLRVEQMLANGLIKENEMIRTEGLNDFSALDTIGYKEFDGYFEGEKSIDEVKEEIITHTNQYAKRQRTWFKRNKNIILVKDYIEILDCLNTHLDSV